jgi:hypothetical protein
LAKGSTRGDVIEKVKELNAIKVRPEEDEYSLLSESFIEQMTKGNTEQ